MQGHSTNIIVGLLLAACLTLFLMLWQIVESPPTLPSPSGSACKCGVACPCGDDDFKAKKRAK